MSHCLAALTTRARLMLLTLAAWWATGVTTYTQRRTRLSDTGSETTEKAVLTSIVLGLALGLGAAIRAAVQNYQGQIH